MQVSQLRNNSAIGLLWKGRIEPTSSEARFDVPDFYFSMKSCERGSSCRCCIAMNENEIRADARKYFVYLPHDG